MGKIRIFDLDIYPERCILSAIEAYKEIAFIDMKKRDGKVFCSVSSSIYDEEETSGEFSNYILALTTKHYS